MNYFGSKILVVRKGTKVWSEKGCSNQGKIITRPGVFAKRIKRKGMFAIEREVL